MKKIFLILAAVIFMMPMNLYGAEKENNKILVVYFSNPEDVRINGVDGVASASVQFLNGERVGSTEKMAKIIQEYVGGDIFKIETETSYPTEHDALVDFADNQRQREEKPKLKTHIENFESYDIVFIGYPIWWYSLPMPLLSFLDEYDLSGKNVIPFSTHGGSRFSGTVELISQLEPDADVNRNGLTISRGRVERADSNIIQWLKELGY